MSEKTLKIEVNGYTIEGNAKEIAELISYLPSKDKVTRIVAPEQKAPSSSPELKCPQCGSGPFKNKQGLKHHVTAVHKQGKR